MIKPALRRGWQDRQTVRYGVTPAHAVLLGPLDTATETFLTLLDGTRGLEQLRAAAQRLGLGAGAADRLAQRLTDAGVLEDAAADRAAAARISERLRPDLAAQTLLTRAPGAGLTRLTARRGEWVQVRGAGRVGAALAVALAQAGVGRVEVVDGGRVAAADTSPGGIPAGYTGRRRDGAARAAVRAAVPWRSPGPVRPKRVGLVVFAPRDGVRAYVPDPVPAEDMVTAGTPHLYAGVVEATGFVGPLVLPGVSCCAECLLRQRTRREPGLPLMVGQWRNARVADDAACDATLAVTIAGLAAATALAFIDRAPEAPIGVRSELSLPELEMRRHQFTPDPECPCGAGAASAAGQRTQRDGDPTAAAVAAGAAGGQDSSGTVSTKTFRGLERGRAATGGRTAHRIGGTQGGAGAPDRSPDRSPRGPGRGASPSGRRTERQPAGKQSASGSRPVTPQGSGGPGRPWLRPRPRAASARRGPGESGGEGSRGRP